MNIYMAGIVLAEVGLILYLVLRKTSVKRPSMDLKVFSFLAITGGVILLFRSYLEHGYYGPLWVIVFVRDVIREPGAINFWGFLNPYLFNGLFAIGLLFGGAGILRMRSWARTLFIYLSGAAALLSAITLIKFAGRMDGTLKAVTFLYCFLALIIALFLMQERVARLFSSDEGKAAPPQETRL